MSNYKTHKKVNQFILGLSYLQNLTSLTLHGFPDRVHSTLYKSIAKSCPLLSHLSMNRGTKHVEKVNLLSLILIGKVVGKMFSDGERPWWGKEDTKWSVDKTLQLLRVPSECLAPLCSTLQYLGDYFYDTGHLNSTFAFVLRHLPKLQNLESRCIPLQLWLSRCSTIRLGWKICQFRLILKKKFGLDKHSVIIISF